MLKLCMPSVWEQMVALLDLILFLIKSCFKLVLLLYLSLCGGWQSGFLQGVGQKPFPPPLLFVFCLRPFGHHWGFVPPAKHFSRLHISQPIASIDI